MGKQADVRSANALLIKELYRHALCLYSMPYASSLEPMPYASSLMPLAAVRAVQACLMPYALCLMPYASSRSMYVDSMYGWMHACM